MREELANLVGPVFSYALGVREQLLAGQSLDLDQVQAVLKSLLSADLQLPAWSEINGGPGPNEGEFLGIRYALVSWLDELFVESSPWQEQWSPRVLEKALYGSRDRGWKFWEQARLADARLGGDAVEAYLACVLLGFRGNLRDGPGRLAEWVRAAQARVPRPAPLEFLGPNEIAPPTPLVPLTGSTSWPWPLLGREQWAGDFPEVDAAWEEACEALRLADLDPATAPLFVVAGQPSAGEEAFLATAFPSSSVPLRVRGAPAHPGAPFRVHATRDAIYVVCPGLLGLQAGLTGQGGTGGSRQIVSSPRPIAQYATIAHALPSPRGGLTKWAAPPRLRQATPPETGRAEGRLYRLGQLLVRTRRPGAPLNGALLLLSHAALCRDEDADQLARSLQRDLAVLRQAVGLHCPVFALVCGLERLQGFCAFAGRFPPEQRENRLGQSLPLAVAAPAEEIAGWLEEAARRVCHELVPAYGHAHWRAEGSDEAAVANQRQFRFAHQLSRARQRLEGLLTACVEATRDEVGRNWFGGLYLAGTGQEPAGQAFVAGAIQKMFDHRRWLAWSPESVEEDESYRRWAWGAMAGVAVLLLGLLGLLWLSLAG